MARRRPINWYLLSVVMAVTAALGIYSLLIPFVSEYILTESQTGWSSSEGSPYSNYSLYEQFVRRLGIFITCGWFFIFGASIGSFINVVVWRMPLGKSVLAKPSFCPRCHAKIRLIDNIPVFGWFKLRGRCRKCRLPISFRYPLIEFLFGTIFLLLFLCEFLTGAANIPGSNEYELTGVVYLVWFLKPELMSMYLFHCGLLTFLLTSGLMRFDGSAIPIRLVIFVLLTGFGCVVAFPELQTVRFWGVMEMYHSLEDGSFPSPSGIDRFLTPFIGLAVGGTLGCWIGFVASGLMVTDEKQRKRTWLGLIIAGASVGMFLGWQAAISVFGLHGLLLVLGLPVVWFLNHRISSTRFVGEQLALATLIHLLIWTPIESVFWWPSGTPNLLALSVGVMSATIGCVAFANFCCDAQPKDVGECNPISDLSLEENLNQKREDDENRPSRI